MTWLLWRQHRSQAMVAAIGLALLGLALWITGVNMAGDYHRALATCPPSDGSCRLVGQLFRGDGAIIDTVHMTIAVPIILGIFLGAALIARETEAATNVLAWTQSRSRRSWLLAKVGLALGAAVVVSGLVSALVTWWSGTPNSLYGNRFEGAQFDTQDIVPMAYAAFAVALGLFFGSVLRRTLPALGATVLGFAAVRILVGVYVRPHWASAVTLTTPLSEDGAIPSGSLTMSNHLMDPAGRAVGAQLQIPASCVASARSQVTDCLARLGYRQVTTYTPASRYWRFQLSEAGLFIALAVVLTLIAIVLTLRRDA